MTRTLATLSLILAAVFVLAILALHALSPEINPMVSGISYYALGKLGWLLGVAVASVGISGIALAVALWPTIRTGLGRTGIVLLILWGVSAVMAGLFPIDAPGAAPTLSGRIHGLLGMNFLLVVPALLLIEFGATKGATSARPRSSTYWLAWALLAAAILLFVFNGPLYSFQVGGAVQRLYWLVLVLWLVLEATRTRREAAIGYRAAPAA